MKFRERIGKRACMSNLAAYKIEARAIHRMVKFVIKRQKQAAATNNTCDPDPVCYLSAINTK